MAYLDRYLLIQELQENPIEWLYLIVSIAVILLLAAWLDHREEKKKPHTRVKIGSQVIDHYKTNTLSTQSFTNMCVKVNQKLKKLMGGAPL